MNRRLLLSILALAAGIAAVFAAPAALVSPGPLIPGHAKIEGGCFACHAPFRGPVDDKCVACHKPSEIGRKTPGKTAFHQQLSEQRCSACHTDHTGATGGKATRAFNHGLLRIGATETCSTCHAPPADGLHKTLNGDCKTCHTSDRWTPATFEHAKLFRFDRHHPSDCATCHPKNDFKRYTCYGCHEHSEARLRGEHWEEGIRDFADCVTCHRSGDEEEAEHLWRSQRRQSLPNEASRRWFRGEHEEHGEHEGHDDD